MPLSKKKKLKSQTGSATKRYIVVSIDVKPCGGFSIVILAILKRKFTQQPCKYGPLKTALSEALSVS